MWEGKNEYTIGPTIVGLLIGKYTESIKSRLKIFTT